MVHRLGSIALLLSRLLCGSDQSSGLPPIHTVVTIWRLPLYPQASANPERKGRGGPRKTGSKANLSGMEGGPAASAGGPAASAGGPADSGSGRKRQRASMGVTS